MIDADSPILMLRLLRSAYWFDEGLRRATKAEGGANFPRAQALVVLNVTLGMRKPQELSDAMGISRQAIGRLIGDLVEAGALVVKPDPDDGRATIVEIDPSAEDQMRNTLRHAQRLEKKLGDIIGADRLAVLRAALAEDWGEPDLP
ncbi:MarR family winged helix-turn-helix transcriptional regulator [Phaeobacter sp. C3_T13_0]|uniref:MarR family winged helix-turn-helix transcriptional regulator n=1 Tax=Phaeobacter cretensis TaxID=3342641 RepID=UPI0039BC5A30